MDSALRLGGAGARLQEDLPARHHLVRLVQAGGPHVLHPHGHHGPRPWDSCVGVRGWELKGWRWTGMAGWAGVDRGRVREDDVVQQSVRDQMHLTGLCATEASAGGQACSHMTFCALAKVRAASHNL